MIINIIIINIIINIIIINIIIINIILSPIYFNIYFMVQISFNNNVYVQNNAFIY